MNQTLKSAVRARHARWRAALLAANPASIDPKFRQANQYQSPREIRFTVKFEF